MADIEAESRRHEVLKSDVVREKLERAPRKRRRSASFGIADLIGSVDNLPTDLTARKKQYFATDVMARNVLVDAGFVVALLSSRDNRHEWAMTQAAEVPPPPWSTCEAVLSESFHLLGGVAPPVSAPLRRRALLVTFSLPEIESVVKLIENYSTFR